MKHALPEILDLLDLSLTTEKVRRTLRINSRFEDAKQWSKSKMRACLRNEQRYLFIVFLFSLVIVCTCSWILHPWCSSHTRFWDL